MRKPEELIHESDEIYLKFGADTEVFTAWTKKKRSVRIRRKAINANLKADRMSDPSS